MTSSYTLFVLPLGHIGITFGVGLVGYEAYRRVKTRKKLSQEKENHSQVPNDGEELFSGKRGSWAIFFCLLGSILPDIIDKPVGHYLFGQFFGYNGRIFSHTLLFSLSIFGIGLYFYLSHKNPMGLMLTYGVFMHLILDSMWQNPQTLFWPLLGWDFPQYIEYDFLISMWYTLCHNPSVFIPELIGVMIVLAYIARKLYFRSKT